MFEIPEEEVESMSPEDFVGTYTYGLVGWIQHNASVNGHGDLRGLRVQVDGRVCWRGSFCEDRNLYEDRNVYNKHYRTLEDLVQDCTDEELINLFLKEHTH